MNADASKLRDPFRLTLPLLLVALVFACSGGGSTSTGPYGEDTTQDPDAQSGLVEVQLTQDFAFSPSEVTIEPGTTVRWVNSYDIFHTVTPQDPEQAGVWEDQGMSQGDTLEHTFETSGQVYDYYCDPHVDQYGMSGTITVE